MKVWLDALPDLPCNLFRFYDLNNWTNLPGDRQIVVAFSMVSPKNDEHRPIGYVSVMRLADESNSYSPKVCLIGSSKRVNSSSGSRCSSIAT